MRDVAAKAAENVARLAALFHVLEHGASGTITSEEIRAAASIVGWHLNEARRLLAERGRAWLEESGRRRSVVINPALLTELE